jgi:Na+/proline symporter
MGGGTALSAISGGLVPFWFGGAIVALVVMSYVFFGGMRGDGLGQHVSDCPVFELRRR